MRTSQRFKSPTPLEYHQHLVVMLDDMLLKLDELELEIAQRLLVSLVAVLLAARLDGLRRCGSDFSKSSAYRKRLPI